MLRACAAILLLSSGLFAADTRQFPYEAVVAADDVEVRCGPGTGSAFYVTGKLKRDSKVTVHRHDPGGWYMIAPPSSSFSYIEASYVQQHGANRGTVNLPPVDGRPPGRAIVLIGSELDDSHSASGRQLSHGEEVKILGKTTLRTTQGSQEMLLIQPPPQEFRWVRGEFIVPLDEQHRQASNIDPYQVPADLKPQYIVENRDRIEKQETLKSPVMAESKSPSKEDSGSLLAPDTLQVAYGQLDQIDQHYAKMMEADPTEWDLGGIEAAYTQLAKSAPHPIPSLISKRISALQARKEIAQRIQRFVQLTSSTDQRDAQLARIQALGQINPEGTMEPFAGIIAPLEVTGSTEIALGSPQPIDASGLPATEMSFGSPGSVPVLQAPLTSDTSQVASPPVNEVPSEVQPRLDGAGIIQPTYPPRADLPPFRLVAPGGRVLAYLDPERHVPLHQMVGTAAGVFGRRVYNPRLGTDVIKVQRTIPVRLTD